MKKIITGVLAVTTVALGVVCAVQWKQLRAGNERVRAVEESRRAEMAMHEAQSTRVKELERAKERLDQQVQEFTAVTTMLRTNEVQQQSNLTALAEQVRTAGKNGASTGDGKSGAFGKNMGDMLGKMMKDPAMREMMRGQQKAAVNMMYSGLFKDLNLSAEEKEKFSGILTESQMKNIEKAQGLFGGSKDGASDNTEKVLEDSQKLAADLKQQTDAEIKVMLGEERFAQYEEYQKNVGERMQLTQLKSQLEAASLPLQDQQSAQLLQVMKEEKAAVPPIIPTDNNSFPKKEVFTPENLDKQIKWMDDYNRRVLGRAGQILNPEQLKQYKDFQDQQASMQKLGLKMAAEMFGGDKPVSSPEPIPAK